MNLSNKLNLILKDYSSGKKESAYKKFKKIYLQNNKDIKLRYNLAVMQQELGFFNEAESNYLSLIKHSDDIKYKINLYNLYITKGLFQNALDLENEGWQKLNTRWISFFIFVAILNELVWRTQTEAFWVNFKVWGLLPISFLFAASQVPLINKYKLK